MEETGSKQLKWVVGIISAALLAGSSLYVTNLQGEVSRVSTQLSDTRERMRVLESNYLSLSVQLGQVLTKQDNLQKEMFELRLELTKRGR